jgi:hypothetical protein
VRQEAGGTAQYFTAEAQWENIKATLAVLGLSADDEDAADNWQNVIDSDADLWMGIERYLDLDTSHRVESVFQPVLPGIAPRRHNAFPALIEPAALHFPIAGSLPAPSLPEQMLLCKEWDRAVGSSCVRSSLDHHCASSSPGRPFEVSL